MGNNLRISLSLHPRESKSRTRVLFCCHGSHVLGSPALTLLSQPPRCTCLAGIGTCLHKTLCPCSAAIPPTSWWWSFAAHLERLAGPPQYVVQVGGVYGAQAASAESRGHVTITVTSISHFPLVSFYLSFQKL